MGKSPVQGIASSAGAHSSLGTERSVQSFHSPATTQKLPWSKIQGLPQSDNCPEDVQTWLCGGWGAPPSPVQEIQKRDEGSAGERLAESRGVRTGAEAYCELKSRCSRQATPSGALD